MEGQGGGEAQGNADKKEAYVKISNCLPAVIKFW
jgi:hypothetical protein